MAWFSKFKLLFALKLNFDRGQFYKEISKFDYLNKWEKIQNKVGVAEEICSKNDIVLSKIVGGNHGYQKPRSWIGGWMGGYKKPFYGLLTALKNETCLIAECINQ